MAETTEKKEEQSGSDSLRDRFRTLGQIAMETWKVFDGNEMNIYSGNATLYILMAMVPFFTLAAGSINFLPSEYLYSFKQSLLRMIPQVPLIQSMVNDLINLVNPQTGTVVVSVSLLSLLWSASNGVFAIQEGLMRISAHKKSVVRNRLAAMVYTVLFILMIACLLIFRVFRTPLEDAGRKIAIFLRMPELYKVIHEFLKDGSGITIVAMGVMVWLTYTFLQGTVHKLRNQVPGAVFTTVLWILFSSIFEWFISGFWNASALYGSFASIFLTAMWLKTIIMILFLGASLNKALRQRANRREMTVQAVSA